MRESQSSLNPPRAWRLMKSKINYSETPPLSMSPWFGITKFFLSFSFFFFCFAIHFKSAYYLHLFNAAIEYNVFRKPGGTVLKYYYSTSHYLSLITTLHTFFWQNSIIQLKLTLLVNRKKTQIYSVKYYSWSRNIDLMLSFRVQLLCSKFYLTLN